jgi:arsenate reductase
MSITTILFVCKTNAGRSQMAAAYAQVLGPGLVTAVSLGPAPAESIFPVVIEAMNEDGISLSNSEPTALETSLIQNSDILITMNYEHVCPSFNGVHRCDWRIDDPAGKTVDEVRIIRNHIRECVNSLIGEVMALGGGKLGSQPCQLDGIIRAKGLHHRKRTSQTESERLL